MVSLNQPIGLHGADKPVVKNVLIDLAALLLADNAIFTLSWLAGKGVSVFCYSGLPRRKTKLALRRRGLLDLLADVFYEDTPVSRVPRSFLAVNHPSLVSYAILPSFTVRPILLTP